MSYEPLPDLTDHDQRVLGFPQWCRLNNISEATGRRILGSGQGPIVTQLSERRVGITMRANRAWQDGRARAARGLDPQETTRS